MDFGARIYDSRLGRWQSLDPLQAKYPDLSAYCFSINSPIWVKDDDGRDIIILSSPQGAGGMGHAAVLIGNAKDGWRLYSKNGTYGSSGASGPSDKHPENGVAFRSLEEFANSEHNFNMVENGELTYTSAFRITTDKATDQKMMEAASAVVKSDYNVLNNSCIDVPSAALKAGGLDPGYTTTEATLGVDGPIEFKTLNPIPNIRYLAIRSNNLGGDATKSITPKLETQKKMADNSAKGQENIANMEQKIGEQNAPANESEVFNCD